MLRKLLLVVTLAAITAVASAQALVRGFGFAVDDSNRLAFASLSLDQITDANDLPILIGNNRVVFRDGAKTVTVSLTGADIFAYGGEGIAFYAGSGTVSIRESGVTTSGPALIQFLVTDGDTTGGPDSVRVVVDSPAYDRTFNFWLGGTWVAPIPNP